jgi:hypothetical protein
VNCPVQLSASAVAFVGALEERLPNAVTEQLCAAAAFMEALPNRYAMTGEIQGEVLHIAAEIRGLAELVATA